MKLRAATGAPILLNQNDYALLKMLDVQATWIGMASPGKVEIDRSITNGETVTAGSHSSPKSSHTPGHTEGSICLYFPAEKKLIAGDTLFAGSIGRTDLPGGSMQKILRSVHDLATSLPDEHDRHPRPRPPNDNWRRKTEQSVPRKEIASSCILQFSCTIGTPHRNNRR